ncbi:helix-turn-helix transcriptional regulator [Paraburkholderia sediminicola]|uniref:helix-turn-helix transcriptional regulator n=1 Tax=Paraburkholderia sediminicola TaxID=458836 RepID=UPI0038BCA93F
MHQHINTLPLVGHSRWKQIEPFVGMSRESWRQRCLDGRAPRPIRLGERCTVWNNSEIHNYLADPLNYRPPVSEAWRSNVKKPAIYGVNEDAVTSRDNP